MLLQVKFLTNLTLVFLVIALIVSPSFDAQNAVAGGSSTDLITSVPRTMTYQGILKDGDGNPIPNESKDIIFRIYDDPAVGELEWDETIQITTDDGGYFTATLNNLEIPFEEDYWLELEVDSEILSPRQKLNMVAYAARTDTSDYAFAGGGWVDDGPSVRLETSSDKVGIGTSSPGNKLHVVGSESESVPILNVEQNGTFRATRFFSQNACALWVEHAGNHGLRVTNALGDGIHVANAGGWAGYFNGTGYFSDNVGIGTTSPAEKLDVVGTAQMTGFKMPTGAEDGHVLTSDADGVGTWQAAPGGGSNWTVTDSVLYTNNYWGIARGGVGNVLYGDSLHTHINLGVACTTGTNFENYRYSTVGGGYRNKAAGHWSTVGGGRENVAYDIGATISGGKLNFASSSAAISGGSRNTANTYGAVSGGTDNIAGTYAAVGGGSINGATGEYSAIGGGELNIAYGYVSTVGGGAENNASNSWCTIGGGFLNIASGERATVGGGGQNKARGLLSVVSGGGGVTPADSNSAFGDYSAIGGGTRNIASGANALVGGGSQNSAGGNQATVGGGSGNTSSQEGSTVGGGNSNTSSAIYATVGGGANNIASGQFATVGGGSENTANSENATVGGGNNNGATNSYATVSGGVFNFAYGLYSVVAGGADNTADGDYSAILGGVGNVAGNSYATVPGGHYNTAAGEYSFAAGRRAKANHNGAFVWADQTDADFISTSADQFLIRASGGVGIGTNSPAEKLDVVGNIHASGTISSGNSIAIDGTNDKITASSGTIDFDNENLITTGKATIGPGHTNAGVYAFIAGLDNATGGNYSTVGGGWDNAASTDGSTVAGGVSDTASGTFSTVGGGAHNVASGQHSTIAGGNVNLASGLSSTVSGGAYDTASGDNSCISGGIYNVASGNYATVGGGFHNRSRGLYSIVSGGGGPIPSDSNAAIGDWSTIGGGMQNTASGEGTIVGGGFRNTASVLYSTIGGGTTNVSSGGSSTVGGGAGNAASGAGSTVGGGSGNVSSGGTSTVGGGWLNTAYGNRSVVGGGYSNTASGHYSTVGGGHSNTASGDYSLAAGRRAKANHNGTFVWADQTDADFASTGANQFLIRASGGVGIGTTSPTYKLDVLGSVGIDIGSNFNDVALTIEVPANQSGLISRIFKGGSLINVVDSDGHVGIGTFSPQGALDVTSTTGAFIVPRMTTTQRNALSAVNGMIIYNTTANQFNFYENGAWVTK